MKVDAIIKCIGSKRTELSASSAICLSSYLRCQCDYSESCLLVSGLDVQDGCHDRETRAARGQQAMAITMLAARLIMRDDPVLVVCGAILLHALTERLSQVEALAPGLYQRWLSSPWLLNSLNVKIVYFSDAKCSQTSAALLLCYSTMPETWRKSLSSAIASPFLQQCALAVRRSLAAVAVSTAGGNESNDVAMATAQSCGMTDDGAGNGGLRGLGWFVQHYSETQAFQTGRHQGKLADMENCDIGVHVEAGPGSGNTDGIRAPGAERCSELDKAVAALSCQEVACVDVTYISGVPIILAAPAVLKSVAELCR